MLENASLQKYRMLCNLLTLLRYCNMQALSSMQIQSILFIPNVVSLHPLRRRSQKEILYEEQSNWRKTSLREEQQQQKHSRNHGWKTQCCKKGTYSFCDETEFLMVLLFRKEGRWWIRGNWLVSFFIMPCYDGANVVDLMDLFVGRENDTVWPMMDVSIHTSCQWNTYIHTSE